MHATGVIDPVTGRGTKSSGAGLDVGLLGRVESSRLRRREDIVAITAAMAGPTGLAAFGEKFPDRIFDVGIAEQHAMTSAAGLALGGLHPRRSYLLRPSSIGLSTSWLMDVALLKQPVTVVLDRAGVTGVDGASHNGVWDLSLLGIIPGIRVAAPRDADTLREELDEALLVDDGPTVVRFPKGAVPEAIPAVKRLDGMVDVLKVQRG